MPLCARWAVGVLGVILSAASVTGQPVTAVGLGSYYTSPPAGAEVPSDSNGAPVLPRTSPGFSGPVPTNKWWSSIVWPRYPGNVYGQAMHPNPLSVRATAQGLQVASPRTPVFNATDYYFEFNDQTRGLTVGAVGLNNADLRVAAAGDWSVTAVWTAPASGPTLRATFGRGMPFVYAEVTGGDALVTLNTIPGAPVVWANRGNVIGISIGSTPYALFAPSGATWTLNGSTARSSLNGRGYYSVAALPEATTAALDLFAAHAFAFVTNTRASWTYDAPNSRVNARFDFDTVAKEGAEAAPLIALYRHQWLNSPLPTTGYTYPSARGTMKLANAGSFTCAFPFHGLIPTIPDVGAVPQAELYALVNDQYLAPSLSQAADTYGAGRSYGKVAQLVYLADQAGHTAAKNRFLDFLKQDLAEWFTVGSVAGGGGGRSAFQAIQAESFDASQGVTISPITGGQAVTEISNGDYLRFNAVDFTTGSPATRLLLQYASTSSGSGLFQLRIDSLTGPVIAEGGVGGNGGTFAEVALGLSGAAATVTGLHDVYITCSTPYAGELFRLDWFRLDRSGAPADRYFAYDAPWSTLLGYPGSFGSTGELNDHHFHYGYFIIAAATVAQFDPVWASQNRYGPMVKLLISDAANGDRADTRFPFLRNFDPYAGHSQASGHAGFASGNNQESSSEAINFAAGVALWGASTNDAALRDLGIYLYASESAAIQQYWFDADNAVFPVAAPKRIAGIVWDSGVAYATFFSAEPEMIHGINFLPITSASLHLGLRPDQIVKSYSIMTTARGGPPIYWQVVHWCALAMADPAAAMSLLNVNPGYQPDGADSRAQMVQWIRSLNTLGLVEAGITADWPHYAVFNKAGARTHIAWNPTAQPVTVTFSSGLTVCVEPGRTVVVPPGGASTTCPCAADFNNSGSVSVQDIFDFLAAYFGGCTAAGLPPCVGSADVNHSGGVSVQDVFDFLATYFAPC